MTPEAGMHAHFVEIPTWVSVRPRESVLGGRSLATRTSFKGYARSGEELEHGHCRMACKEN